jgi:predicted lipid carrier protein YhbT
MGTRCFFFRELFIEGYTETVLVLRNAVDIDIVEGLTSIIPVFSKTAKSFVHKAKGLYARMSVDLSATAASHQAPLERRIKTKPS